jgi:hypothetical protein
MHTHARTHTNARAVASAIAHNGRPREARLRCTLAAQPARAAPTDTATGKRTGTGMMRVCRSPHPSCPVLHRGRRRGKGKGRGRRKTRCTRGLLPRPTASQCLCGAQHTGRCRRSRRSRARSARTHSHTTTQRPHAAPVHQGIAMQRQAHAQPRGGLAPLLTRGEGGGSAEQRHPSRLARLEGSRHRALNARHSAAHTGRKAPATQQRTC